ncbi:ubiquitin-protein ligase peroxin 10 Ecym_1328 [Eremothecium cymbalariae DBVPG|uniref:RING-type E3 ubiquitin transferase n=1 Tax=Eremothecium cymbalariae (strain CBS 270.75 / DBVPG 7215 / KCTC 17166 / NRRL Y-17582) TaxID=931890 RepID=G8JN99_ERECY|nr:hypothetical protein Ecym_1328 [Eremothecium cymbalariae DBVPG\
MSEESKVFPFADAPSIVQAHQKDIYIESILGNKLEDAIKAIKGQFFRNRYSQEIFLSAKLLYLSLTTLKNKRTLGEEYVDLIYVDKRGTGLVKKWQRMAFILSYAILPYGLSKLFKYTKTRYLDNDADDANCKRRTVLNYLSNLMFKDIMDNILNIHLLAFYLTGEFYQLSKRVFGLRYAIGHDINKDEKEFRTSSSRSYRILGGIVFLQILAKVLPSVNSMTKSYLESSDHDVASSDDVLTGIPSESTTHIDLSNPKCLPLIPEHSRSCILCLVDMVDPSCLPCGHLFCWNCIMHWCTERSECPLCRQHCSKQSILPIR